MCGSEVSVTCIVLLSEKGDFKFPATWDYWIPVLEIFSEFVDIDPVR
jgi:hypothetical protein